MTIVATKATTPTLPKRIVTKANRIARSYDPFSTLGSDDEGMWIDYADEDDMVGHFTNVFEVHEGDVLIDGDGGDFWVLHNGVWFMTDGINVGEWVPDMDMDTEQLVVSYGPVWKLGSVA